MEKTSFCSYPQEAMKNAKELIEEEERDRKKAEKRRAKKKVKHCASYQV